MNPITLAVATLVGVVVLAAPPVAADPRLTENPSGYVHRVLLGVLAHDVDNLWSGQKREDGIDINAEVVFNRPGFSILSGRVRPNIGASVNSQGDTSKLYAGIVWEFETRSGFFFNTGVGAAIHNGELERTSGDKKALGSRLLFRIPFEFGCQVSERASLSVMFDHVSNAYLADDNEGMDSLGVRFGWRF